MRIARLLIKISIMEISKTDSRKVIAYLDDACKLYEALPMQSMKSRAHMIRQLTAKLKTKLNNHESR